VKNGISYTIELKKNADGDNYSASYGRKLQRMTNDKKGGIK